MYRYQDIRQVHLEITTRCSVRCPQCPRNTGEGVTNPDLPQTELLFADFLRIFEPVFIAQLESVIICGNYGDPTASSELIPIIQYLRTSNPTIRIQINTHGSARPESWWQSLARLGVTCHFSIDGLEDTNHIYRRGADWRTIMKNVRGFIAAGGVAVWDYLVFAHNEHQVDGARALSAAMGFSQFVPKKTARFVREGQVTEEQPLLKRDGAVAGVLQMPQNPVYRNAALIRMRETLTSAEEYENYLGDTRIRCKVAAESSIYVSAEGLVFPCCYLAHIYPARPYLSSEQSRFLVDTLPDGRRSISAFHFSIAEILQGKYFKDVIPSGWSPGRGRTRMCSQQCGEIDLLSAQR